MASTTKATAHSGAHAHHHGTDHHDDGAVHVHVAPAPFYWGIFGALIVLTVVTVAVSYVDLGSANTVVAVLVASVKATLVAAFFMHLSHDKLFNTVLFLGSFVFLGIFFFLTNEDTSTRNRIDEDYGAKVNPQTGQVAPGGIAQDKLDKLVGQAPPGAAGHGGHGAAGGAHH